MVKRKNGIDTYLQDRRVGRGIHNGRFIRGRSVRGEGGYRTREAAGMKGRRAERLKRRARGERNPSVEREVQIQKAHYIKLRFIAAKLDHWKG